MSRQSEASILANSQKKFKQRKWSVRATLRNKTRSKTAESDKTLCLFVRQANLQIFSAQLEEIVKKSGNKK